MKSPAPKKAAATKVAQKMKGMPAALVKNAMKKAAKKGK